MSSEFGHKERKTKRQNNLKADVERAAQIIDTAWKENIYTPKNVIIFFELVDDNFRRELKTTAGHIEGRELLLKHIRTVNSQVTDTFPVPMVPIYIERAKPVKSYDWLIKGREIANLAKHAMNYWSTPRSYTPEDILGWTLLSAILWGGLNDQAALSDFLDSLIENRPLRPFFQHLIIMPLDAADSSYGNNTDEKTLTRSFSFIPDDVTRCWIVKLKMQIIDFQTKPNIGSLLNHVLKQLNSDIRFESNKSNPVLLNYANFHWEQIPNVFIDQAISQVLTQDQKCCSLSAFEFANFYSPQILTKTERIHLNPDILFQVNYSAFNSKSKKIIVNSAACQITSKIRKALATKDPTHDLEKLKPKQTNESTKRLVGWLCELAASGDLQSSSIERYMDAVAHPWLIQTLEENIKDYDAEDFEVLYQDIVEAKSAKGTATDTWLLPRFHKYQVEHFGAPQDVNFNIAKSKQICSASVLSPLVFQAMCEAMQNVSGINQQDKRTCLLVLIIAYRTGMRLGEITGLLMNDVEWGAELSFLIRDNAVRKVKTSSAFRRIPVWAFLKPEEFRLLCGHLEEAKDVFKKNKKKASVFFIANSMNPLRKSLPSDLFKIILDQFLVNHNYTFHSLRHTAISNLSLILFARQELIEHLTDYDSHDCERIRNALLGTQHDGQDKWFALAQVAGHLTPDHSFQHYLHFAHLMGGFELCQGKIEMPFTALQEITGYTKRKISSKTSTAFNKDYTAVLLNQIRPLLTKDLAPHIQDWQELLPNAPECKPKPTDNDTEDNHDPDQSFVLPGSESSQITMQTVHLILSKLEIGMSIGEVITRHHVDSQEAILWVERAQKLAKLKTQRGKSKLFTKERLDNHPDLLLAPTKPHSPKEQSLLAKYFMKACDVHGNNREGLHQFLDTFFDRVSTSRGEIRFTLDEEVELAAFLQIGEKLIDIKQWRLRVRNLEEAQKLIDKMKLNSRLTISETESELIYDDQNKHNTKYRGYSLSIIHPNEQIIQDKKGSQKEFPVTSGLLKYFCHMLAIADLSYPIKSDESVGKV